MNDKCYKTRKIILPPANRGEVELLTPELKEAKLHLKECKECQSFFSQQDDLRKFIKDNLPTTRALPSVREEIFKSISNSGYVKKQDKNLFPFKNYTRYWWVAAAIIALIISVLFINPFPEGIGDKDTSKITEISSSEISGHQLTEALVDDYINYRLSEQPAEYVTNNPQDLNNWFSRKLDFNARFSSIDELQLVGGRACHLFQRRVALAFYSQVDKHKPDQWVSLFIFKDYQVNLSQMKTERLNNRTIWCSESRGYELAVWKQNDLLYALVADNNIQELVEKIN